MLRFLLQRVALPASILIAGILAMLWLRSQSTPPGRAAQPRAAPEVQTIALGEPTGGLEIVAHGVVVPTRETTLSAQVAGHIVDKSPTADSGHFVAADDRLLTIDSRRYALEVKTRLAQVHQVEADLRQLETEQSQTASLLKLVDRRIVLANKELAALRELAEQNATAATDVDRTERELLRVESERARLQNILDQVPVRRERLEAALAVAQSEHESAELDLADTRVVAPHSGLVIHDAVEVGSYVQPGDVLLKVEDTSAYEVEVHLRTDQLYWLWDGDRNTIATDVAGHENASLPATRAEVTFSVAGREYSWPGALVRLEGSGIDPTTQSVKARVAVDERARADATDGPLTLVKGMFVTVTLFAEPRATFLQVPHEAVQPNDEVWSIVEGRLRVDRVRLVKVLDEHVLIRADSMDLQPGAKLIISPLRSAFDGMEVREATEP